MSVSTQLQRWKAAHDAAKRARLNRDWAGNLAALTDAQQALADAHDDDPDALDPAWLSLPVRLSDLQVFYADALHPDRSPAPRFTRISSAVEQQALKDLKAQADTAKRQKVKGEAVAEPLNFLNT